MTTALTTETVSIGAIVAVPETRTMRVEGEPLLVPTGTHFVGSVEARHKDGSITVESMGAARLARRVPAGGRIYRVAGR
jgi:hypothetical protein